MACEVLGVEFHGNTKTHLDSISKLEVMPKRWQRFWRRMNASHRGLLFRHRDIEQAAYESAAYSAKASSGTVRIGLLPGSILKSPRPQICMMLHMNAPPRVSAAFFFLARPNRMTVALGAYTMPVMYVPPLPVIARISDTLRTWQMMTP